jgi:hypothetical protein
MKAAASVDRKLLSAMNIELPEDANIQTEPNISVEVDGSKIAARILREFYESEKELRKEETPEKEAENYNQILTSIKNKRYENHKTA